MRDPILALKRWASVHEPVQAMLLNSTRAIPDASVDIFSDYDVILIVQDIHPFVTDPTWLNDFGDVLVVNWDPIHPDPTFGIDMCANVTQYANGLKLDFTMWLVALFQKIVTTTELAAELDAGYQVLLDKEQLTATLRKPTFKAYVPKPSSEVAYQSLVNDFLIDAPYVAKCLWRDGL
jgi:aminoglycoside 6-adenylyltransferase